VSVIGVSSESLPFLYADTTEWAPGTDDSP